MFSSRCKALGSSGRYAEAEADCAYALALRPQLPDALFWLATAEEKLGKRAIGAEHFRSYAALDTAAPLLREQALARAKVPAPTAPAVPGAEAAARLVVYRNHRFAGAGTFTLVLDNRLVGDLSYGQYVEIETTPGEHLLEARSQVSDVFEVPRVWTQPVRLGGDPVYANFDTSVGKVILQEVPRAQARQEVRDDCQKAYARRIGPDSVVAPPVQRAAPPPIVIVQGGVRAESAGRACRFSSDCGDASEYSCRHWRGQNVCMGYGSVGAPCWFGSDCLSGSCEFSKVCR